ncbi:MAG: DNA polymerase ligase N-terminal domain-containing protein [Armatimonadota bacterium]
MPQERSLDEYASKRRFDETPEPEPEYDDTGRMRFVVQEHHASHLHWDFRLEMDGVLKSWAIPKGPPEEPGIRRLAVQTEDHPIGYIDFEGEIAEGNYGAGTVSIWDSGTYDLESQDAKKLAFTLHGTRLNGGYALVQTSEDQWIILKRKND